MADRLVLILERFGKKIPGSKKVAAKVFFGCFVHTQKLIFWLIFRGTKISFFKLFQNCYPSICNKESRKMMGMSGWICRKTVSGGPFLFLDAFVPKSGVKS